YFTLAHRILPPTFLTIHTLLHNLHLCKMIPPPNRPNQLVKCMVPRRTLPQPSTPHSRISPSSFQPIQLPCYLPPPLNTIKPTSLQSKSIPRHATPNITAYKNRMDIIATNKRSTY